MQEALVRLRGAWSRVRRQSEPEAYVRTTMARPQISIWMRPGGTGMFMTAAVS